MTGVNKPGGKEAKWAILLFLAFWLMELSIYFIGFIDASKTHRLQVLEGPVSLVVAAVGYVFWLRYLRLQGLNKTWQGAVAITILSSLLLVVPVCSSSDSEWSIEVYKTRRLLEVHRGSRVVQAHAIALGGNSEGDKEMMGDLKTPLGEFRVVDKGPSQFHKWLGLSYPSAEDAWRGRIQGKIMWAELYYLLVENRNGRIPYGNSALGGAIGIHGGGAKKDWTLGCIALDNSSIDQFFELIPLGARVTIRP